MYDVNAELVLLRSCVFCCVIALDLQILYEVYRCCMKVLGFLKNSRFLLLPNLPKDHRAGAHCVTGDELL